MAKTIGQTMEIPRISALGEKRNIEKAKGGGKDAFDQLFAPYRSELRSFIQSKVPEDEVEDVLQDVSIGAWKALPNFDARSKLRTWLYGICINKIKDLHRRRAKVGHNISLEGHEPTAEEHPMGNIDLGASIWHMVRTLPEPQSEVIELYYRQGLTLAEISNVLDRNLNTVKYQFCQAHARLAKAGEGIQWL